MMALVRYEMHDMRYETGYSFHVVRGKSFFFRLFSHYTTKTVTWIQSRQCWFFLDKFCSVKMENKYLLNLSLETSREIYRPV